MRALVIGANGFVGRWLCVHLLGSGDTVHAIVGPNHAAPIAGVGSSQQVDVRDPDGMRRSIHSTEPEAIYYLAGVSRREDRDDLDAAAGISVIGALSVLRAATDLPSPPRLLYVSTGLVYAPSDKPLSEDGAIAPQGVYAAAKYAGEVAVASLGKAAGVDVVVARAFNHIGPGQSEAFVVPTIARQVVAIGNESEPRAVRLKTGDPVRDFCDVRDVVRAYRLLVASGEPAVYNIGSGEGVPILHLARLMLDIAGVAAEVTAEDGLPAGEPASVVASNQKIRALGWTPEFSLRDSLRDVLEDQRQAHVVPQ